MADERLRENQIEKDIMKRSNQFTTLIVVMWVVFACSTVFFADDACAEDPAASNAETVAARGILPVPDYSGSLFERILKSLPLRCAGRSLSFLDFDLGNSLVGFIWPPPPTAAACASRRQSSRRLTDLWSEAIRSHQPPERRPSESIRSPGHRRQA